jgi:hypothetical protein
MTASILIVGEDEMLSHTRSLLLREWDTCIMNPAITLEPIEFRRYDLLVFCHTVSDDRARDISARAVVLSPNVKVVAISRPGDDREVLPADRVVEAMHPQKVLEAVRQLVS